MIQIKISLDKLFLIQKNTIVFSIYCVGILLAYWGSLMPWFLWPLAKYIIILVSLLAAGSMYFSYSQLEDDIFSRENYSLPTALIAIIIILYRITHGLNVFGLIEGLLHIFIFFSIFKLSIQYLQKLIKVICIIMGGFLAISMFAFFLNLFGFPLPSTSIATEDMMYTFENYYIFMVDDRAFFALFPRFHSVFLEPGHLGTATTFLLLTQIGKWNKWYNIVLIVATIITFSLAAYVLLVMVLFISAWIQHKQFIMKAIGIVVMLLGIGIGAFFYEQGDNLLFSLIIERLEVDDGKLAGDNRVTGSFEAVYDDFLKSNDILFGRKYSSEEFGFGNAGYRVFIYDNGLIGLFLLILFYFSTTIYSRDRRAIISMLLIAAAAFWVRSTPLAFYFFLPLYSLPYIRTEEST